MNYKYLFLLIGLLGTACQSNYSEEVIRDYIEIEKNLSRNTQVVAAQTEDMIRRIENEISYKTRYNALAYKTKDVQYRSYEVIKAIDKLSRELVEKSATLHPNTDEKAFLKSTKNSAVVQQVLWETTEKSIAKAVQLEKQVQTLYDTLLQIVASCWEEEGLQGTVFKEREKQEETLALLAEHLPLREIALYSKKRARTWAQSSFQEQPLAVTCVKLSTLQNDIQVTAYYVVNFMMAQVSFENFYNDKMDILAFSPEPSIHLGETYEVALVLGRYKLDDYYKVVIGKDTLTPINGVVLYKVSPQKTGTQYYTPKFIVPNPLIGENWIQEKTFSFEVLPPK